MATRSHRSEAPHGTRGNLCCQSRVLSIASGHQDDSGTDEDEDWEYEVIMAVDLKGRNSIGCCYYSARERTVNILSQTEYSGPEIIDSRQIPKSREVVFLIC